MNGLASRPPDVAAAAADVSQSAKCCGIKDIDTLSSAQLQIGVVLAWMKKCGQQQCCAILKRLIEESRPRQLNTLWTTLQPALHRDFVYAAQQQRFKTEFIRTKTLIDDITVTSRQRRHQQAAVRCRSADVTNRMTSRQKTVEPNHSTGMCVDNENNRKTLNTQTFQVVHWYRDTLNDFTKMEFLCKLLMQLDEEQISFLSNLLKTRLYRDVIVMLPQKLSTKILNFLSPKQLTEASTVSKLWYHRCTENELWKLKCLQFNPETRQRHVTESCCRPAGGGGIDSANEPLNWKSVYIKSYRVAKNWIRGKCRMTVCHGHSDRVLSITFNSVYLATGSTDRSIKVWDISNGHCVRTLIGHERGVWCLLFYTDNLLVSASYDSTIKVWSLTEGRCLKTLSSHTGPVWAIVRRADTLVSVSEDSTVKVWDVSRCTLLFTLCGHSGPVFAVDFDDEDQLIFTGSADRTVRIWSATRRQLFHTLDVSLSTSIMAVAYCHGFLACSYGNTICVYVITLNADVIGGGVADVTLHSQCQEHTSRVETVRLQVTSRKTVNSLRCTVISAGRDATIKYWNVLTNRRRVRSLAGHEGQVNCICLDETRIASVSYDNTLRLWDFYDTVPSQTCVSTTGSCCELQDNEFRPE